MGWASGSSLLSQIIDTIKYHCGDPEQRTEMYGEIIESFSNADCDTLDECLGNDHAFDEAYETWRKANG